MWEFVAGEPAMTPQEWAAGLARHRFSGEAEMVRADGDIVRVQWGATTEEATGRRLVLVVALSVSGRGRGLRQVTGSRAAAGALSEREREIVRLVALGSTGPEIADAAPDQPQHGAHPPSQLHEENRALARAPIWSRRRSARALALAS